ncbi:hypothetical protein T4A_3568, partial [Trichinella pseudospiralis]
MYSTSLIWSYSCLDDKRRIKSGGDIGAFTVSHFRCGFSKISVRCQRPLNAAVCYA